MARLTALWWWIDRWRKSTAYMDMTLEQQGAYRNLLDEAALRGGPLPADERILAKACGDAKAWRKVRDAVLEHFVLGADGWHNETLDGVIARSAEIAAERAKAGREGNRKRWSQNGRKRIANAIAKPLAKPLAKPIAPDPSPDPSLSDDLTQKSVAARATAFCDWYADTHERLFRIGYMGTNHDWQKTLELCAKFTDADLRDGALVWFGSDDSFATTGTRSIPKFASRITGCLQQARARGIA